jgi:hypothetical protein
MSTRKLVCNLFPISQVTRCKYTRYIESGIEFSHPIGSKLIHMWGWLDLRYMQPALAPSHLPPSEAGTRLSGAFEKDIKCDINSTKVTLIPKAENVLQPIVFEQLCV